MVALRSSQVPNRPFVVVTNLQIDVALAKQRYLVKSSVVACLAEHLCEPLNVRDYRCAFIAKQLCHFPVFALDSKVERGSLLGVEDVDVDVVVDQEPSNFKVLLTVSNHVQCRASQRVYGVEVCTFVLEFL